MPANDTQRIDKSAVREIIFGGVDSDVDVIGHQDSDEGSHVFILARLSPWLFDHLCRLDAANEDREEDDHGGGNVDDEGEDTDEDEPSLGWSDTMSQSPGALAQGYRPGGHDLEEQCDDEGAIEEDLAADDQGEETVRDDHEEALLAAARARHDAKRTRGSRRRGGAA